MLVEQQQEGLKAHEGGQGQNPFDVFSNFFGGGREFPVFCAPITLTSVRRAGQAHQQARRGPTSVSEFEIELSDM